jgi:hypothetical protein
VSYTRTILDLIETGEWEDGKAPTWLDTPATGRADLYLSCARHGMRYHPAEYCTACEAYEERQWMAQQDRAQAGDRS